jgi:ribosomal peptide maturation radical SAM protein 1
LAERSFQRRSGVSLPYESSRGCWWGQKHQCTFCGMNGSGMRFRQKNAERVLTDLRALTRYEGVREIAMNDTILPNEYWKSLIPELQRQPLEGIEIFYEIKANLSYQQMRALKQAGITRLQPGIESLSTPHLRRMLKGVSAAQNIATLRHARSLGQRLAWNILCSFPGDRSSEYQDMARVIPRLSHLQPPEYLGRISFDRFCPYHTEPKRYGITNLRPQPGHYDPFPAEVRQRIAYHFTGDFVSELNDDAPTRRQLRQAVEAWKSLWASGQTPPRMHLTQLTDDVFLLLDTRPVSRAATRSLTREEAVLLLDPPPRSEQAWLTWALGENLVLSLEGKTVALATASQQVMDNLFPCQVKASPCAA